MNVKSIIVLLLTLGWFALCNWWYCCHLRHACAGCAPVAESTAPPPTADRPGDPLLFEASKSTAITSDAFVAYKNGITAKKTEDNLLEITGYYYADEENTSSFENLGLARADAARQLFAEDIPEERIRIKGSLRADSSTNQANLFTAATFNWIKPEIKSSEVIQLDDRAIILFPSASIRKEANPAVDSYLENLAKRVKQTGEKITLTGHTDNQGTEADNMRLGRQRARVIQDFLVSKGVDRSLISIDSKGESEPVATNETEEGRHQNRRTVVRIIKKTD